MFSTYKIWTNSNSILFLSDFVTNVDCAYKNTATRPIAGYLPCVFNFAGFFAPFTHEIVSISKPHVFLFCKLTNGRVGLKFKKWHTTQCNWVGEIKNNGEWAFLFHNFPVGYPPLVESEKHIKIFDMPTLDCYSKWLNQRVFLE